MDSRGTEPTLLSIEDYLLLAPLILLPWAFGGVGIWAYRGAALLLVSAACVCLWKRGWTGWGLGRGSGWLLPAFLLAGWAAFQMVPLPPAVIRLLSPAAHRAYSEALPGYAGGPVADPLAELERDAIERVPEAAPYPPASGHGVPVELQAPDCLGEGWRTISLVPSATRERLAWYVALLLGFLAIRTRVADVDRFRVYRWALFGLLASLALFALVQLQFWNGKIYWTRFVLVQAKPFGPFVNPTNLAGLMELGIPAMAGLAWSKLRRSGRSAVYEPGFAFAAVSAGLGLVAVFASASKAAALLAPAALLVLGFLILRTAKARLLLSVGAVVVLAIIALVLTETRLAERAETYVGRSEEVLMMEGRVVVWGAAGAMVRDFPLTGSGFGTFRHVFQRYVPEGSPRTWGHAHNDYLEMLLDGGIVAGLLVLWLAWGFASRVVPPILRRVERVSPSRLGMALGVASLAVHAVIDFNHQIPADALLWVAFCAMLVPWRGSNSTRST